MDLWLPRESLRTWDLEGTPEDLPAILAAAGELTAAGPVIDPGGGARNVLRCQLTADECGLPVQVGPVAATAFGNVLVQARAAGLPAGNLDPLRVLVRATQQIHRYEPRMSTVPQEH